jgi:hypothetical protein
MTFKEGTVVFDMESDRVGVYMDKVGSQAHLRPLGGGREWPVPAAYVRLATPEECASAQAALLSKPVRTTP